MSSLGSPNPFFIAGKKTYEVERSLRFNDGDSPSLTRSPSSSGNQSTFTFSWWQKITQPSDSQYPITFSCGSTSVTTGFWEMRLGSLGLYLRFKDSTTVVINSNDRFRDPSAWYHCVIAVDTTQATSSNRIKMYVNNRQITSFEYENYPSQNFNSFRVNSTDQHQWGYGKGYSGAVDGPLDSYLAEINFIDGFQYDPSYFGETNPATGQWNPKKYIGGYGTNGYYLNFSSNTLGTDRSGNGNDFTPNNFSVVAGAGNDALSDTPTNNFATMNPLVPSPTVTWSNGNLDLAGSSSTQYSQNNTSTFGVSSGKWYAEVKYTYGGTTNAYMGICPITAAADANMTGSVTDAAVLRMNNETYIEGTSASSGTSISSGDIIGIALDMDNQKVWFSVQGTYINSGNPSTGANATFDGITAGETIAICGRPLNNTLNFNFGQRDFEYTPPTGFKTLCSANLPAPTIKLPNKHFDTLLWTGTSASHTLTGLNFQPDWFWAKSRSQAYHNTLMDSVRGADRQLWSNRSNDEQTDANFLTSFNSNGLTLGDNSSGTGATNTNGHTYVGWNWNAGDTDGKTYTVTVVSDSGNKYRFDGFGTSAVTLDLAEGGTYIFNYPSAHPFRFSTTSDGTHGGGTEYTTGVTVLSSTSVQIVVAASAPTLYYYCTIHSGMGGAINTNSTLGSSNFDGSIQSTVKVNTTAGFSIVTYTGTATNATVGHGLGVKPDSYWVKRRTGGLGDWIVFHKDIGNTKNLRLNTTDSTFTQATIWNNTDPTSSVVNIGTSSAVNGNGSTYVMYCFSEVAGYSKFGSYKGNGSTDGTFVYTDFRPAVLILKASSFTRGWRITDSVRSPFNAIFKSLFPELTEQEYTATGSSAQGQDFLSNGFKLRSTNTRDNQNGSTYIYLAFAEAPFKNARAR